MIKRRTRLKAGEKTKAWDRIRKKLIERFQDAGITTCELQYSGCWHDNALGFAHRKKRRFCTEEELWKCVLCCTNCHQKIEYIRHDAMYQIVNDFIGRRAQQP